MYLYRAFERPSKPLKGSKLRRTSNLTFLKTWSQITYWKTVIAFVLGNHRICDKYVRKILLHIQNKSIKFTFGERKKERPNFYGMFSQNFPISAAYAAILKMKLPQCDAIGVRTLRHWMAYSEIRQKEVISGRFPITKSEHPRCCARDKALFSIFDPHDSVETNIYFVFAHDFVLALRFWIFFSLLTYITDSTKFLRCFLFTDGRSQLQHSDTSTNSVKRRMLKH